MSLKLALDAFLLPVLVLYQSQVGFVTWANPNAVEGLDPGIIPKIFFLSGLANWVKDDSWLIIAYWSSIGVPHLSKLFLVDLYQFFFCSKIIQLLAVLICWLVVHATKKMNIMQASLRMFSKFINQLNIITFRLIILNVSKNYCILLNYDYECLNFQNDKKN